MPLEGVRVSIEVTPECASALYCLVSLGKIKIPQGPYVLKDTTACFAVSWADDFGLGKNDSSRVFGICKGVFIRIFKKG
jgi:hypothetical protein